MVCTAGKGGWESGGTAAGVWKGCAVLAVTSRLYCRKNGRARELLTAHTLDDRFLSEMRKVKQHSAVMKRSKRAALNYHFSQCCRDWLRAQGKITSKLSHAAERKMLECAGTI